MPIHDWTRVDDGIFHDFHHAWIEEIKRALNGGLLPDDYYALAEQWAGNRGPDVLTLQSPSSDDGPTPAPATTGLVLAPPKARFTVETGLEFYRRKQKAVVVRHVSGDRVIAVIEVVSRGNKTARRALRDFAEKAVELLNEGIHLLIADLYPPRKFDPQGIHAAIWEEVSGEEFELPADKRLTVASYAAGESVRAFVEPVAVGDSLPEMPLFLTSTGHMPLPLERTYQTAYAAVPRRWRDVLQQA
ncbi:MAG: DUF4058 family protein [Gemmataceae bacterium]